MPVCMERNPIIVNALGREFKVSVLLLLKQRGKEGHLKEISTKFKRLFKVIFKHFCAFWSCHKKSILHGHPVCKH